MHEHPQRLTLAALVSCEEIRKMHSAYGYYGLYLYLRKDFSYSESVRGKDVLAGLRAAATCAAGARGAYGTTLSGHLPVSMYTGAREGFHTISNERGLYCPREKK